MSRCLVTGGAGFVASHVVDALIEAEHEVTVLDNLSTGRVENINKKAVFVEGDICDSFQWQLLDKDDYDYVFHLAALARIQPSIEDPITSNDTNLNGTLNVLEYCRRNQAKVIFSSSSSIYEGSKLPTSEISEIEPKNPYALQKWIAEQYIVLYSKLYDLDYTIMRYFNVYGERQILDGAYAAVIGIFVDQKNKGQKLSITNDGEQRRDFTYCKDVAQANLLAINWGREVYNIGSGVSYSINEIADFVGGEKDYIGNRVGEVRATLANSSKAQAAGWKPTTDIKDWIKEQL